MDTCMKCRKKRTAKTINATIDKKTHRIQLCTPCKTTLNNQLQKWEAPAKRPQKPMSKGATPYPAAKGLNLTEIRTWARDKNIPVSARGRIDSRVLNMYRSWEKDPQYLKTSEAKAIRASL